MKTQSFFLMFALAFTSLAANQAPLAAQTPAQPAAAPTPPPSSPPKRSAAELEKLVASIALYPDPLIATMLPASVYPLEIVQAARFVADTNNLAKLDAQPWDDSVKAVARVPDAIKRMNDDIAWTIELGEAFLAQDKDILDAIQNLRSKAQKSGTLQTTPQQIVVVTNMIIEKTVEQQVVVVTNTVVQIQPSSSSVVYVPTYNPYTVYYPPPAYVYNPYAPLVTFAAGVAVGAIIANNNCNWYGGGCYHGGDVDIDVDVDRNVNRDSTRNVNRDGAGGGRQSATSTQKKWQPDQSRLSKSGSPSVTSSARNAESRGYGSGGAKPSTGTSAARPSTGTAGARPSTGTAGTRPSTGTPSASRPSASAGASRPAPSASASRPSPSPSTSANRSSSSSSRPSSSGSAYGGMSSGSSARSSSSRGNSSRSSGFSGGRGGGSRGGGGRR